MNPVWKINYCLKVLLLLMYLFSLALFFPFEYVEGVEINSLRAEVKKGVIVVDAELRLDESQMNDLANGIQKEFEFYIDLFRVWNFWPDEFIHGKKIIRVVKSDPVKKEFSMTSYHETSVREERFNSLETLLLNALRLEGINAFHTNHVLSGKYFVKVSVVSNIRKLAPIIGYLLFFVPEKEFSVEKTSEQFMIIHNEE